MTMGQGTAAGHNFAAFREISMLFVLECGILGRQRRFRLHNGVLLCSLTTSPKPKSCALKLRCEDSIGCKM